MNVKGVLLYARKWTSGIFNLHEVKRKLKVSSNTMVSNGADSLEPQIINFLPLRELCNRLGVTCVHTRERRRIKRNGTSNYDPQADDALQGHLP